MARPSLHRARVVQVLVVGTGGGAMSDDRLIRSASIALHINDADGELNTIYRCDECKALVLSADARDHLWWHDAILYAKDPREVIR
jgi:hypothetical protein